MADPVSTADVALVVLHLQGELDGMPTVRDVGARLGIDTSTAHKRLLAAVDDGWLRHRERRAGAFVPTEKLRELAAQ